MTEESIRRPKGRRGSTGDTEQPEHKRKGFSLGKRMGSSEPVGMPEDLMPTEGPKTQESRSYSASINLGGAPARDQTPSEPQRDTPIETAHEDPAPEAPDAKKRFGFSKKEEDRKGTWGDQGWSASDEEAHRDRRYAIPSAFSQTMTMFMVQTKLYCKSSAFFAMVVMAVMIPVIMAVLPESVKMVVAEFYTGPDSYMGTLLVMLPVMVSLFAAILCGTPIGHEFKDRTAYMNFSLPVSRVSFYLGKYLSGFVLCVGVFMLAYAMALLTTSWEFDAVTGDMVIRSVVCTVVSLFAFTATAFCIGSFSKGPTTMAPFFLMTVVLPLLLVLVSLRYGIEELLLLPVFLPDTALVSLGSSVMGSVNGFFSILGVSFIDIADLGTMLVIGVVWGLAFLILGMFRIMRREM